MAEFIEVTLLPTNNNHQIGIISLNRPKALNAQNTEMIQEVSQQLNQWENNPTISMVILRGSGEKAFCAGGDIRALHHYLEESKGEQELNFNQDILKFFQSEYSFTRRLNLYPKPIMTWANGIVMGGGLGVTYATSHRVVTETSRLAMPEVHIGLHPDAGGSWFLHRMPAKLGLFIGLTASHIKAGDALLGDLADYGIHSSEYPDLLIALQNANWTKVETQNHHILSHILSKFHHNNLHQTSVALPHLHWIQSAMNAGSLEQIGNAIMNLKTDNEWLQTAQSNFISSCPASRAITHEMSLRMFGASLSKCLETELIVSMNCCARHDFSEGVRALLVDKDNRPQWAHMASHLTPTEIDAYFKKPSISSNYYCG